MQVEITGILVVPQLVKHEGSRSVTKYDGKVKSYSEMSQYAK